MPLNTEHQTTIRLKQLTLENFRGFRGTHTFDFDSKNILIYGENGSGKTSVWAAIEMFLEASVAKDDLSSRRAFQSQHYQHNRQPGSVTFNLSGEQSTLDKEYLSEVKYVWSTDETPFNIPEIVAAARIRACLDYRSLWNTYLLHRRKSRVDIWPLLIKNLIRDIQTIAGRSFADRWSGLVFYCNRDIDDEEHIIAKAACAGLNENLIFTLDEIKDTAQEMLDIMSPGLEIEWNIIPSRLSERQEKQETNNRAKKLKYRLYAPQVIIKVKLNGRLFTNYHNLLNEAKLSAIALVIYLAAANMNAKQSSSTFKIIALDDVLIGLDMSNRLPVLDILQYWFSDWQIVLLTYDRAWYELASIFLKNGWKRFEFFATDDIPVWSEDIGFLAKSRSYLDTSKEYSNFDATLSKVPDYKAAGVYARTAFEWMMKYFCDKHKVKLHYKILPRYDANDFWTAIQCLEVETNQSPQYPRGRKPILSESLVERINACKSNNLNPLCHSSLNSYHRREIIIAINLLTELEAVLTQPNMKVRQPISKHDKVKFDSRQISEEMTHKDLNVVHRKSARLLAQANGYIQDIINILLEHSDV